MANAREGRQARREELAIARFSALVRREDPRFLSLPSSVGTPLDPPPLPSQAFDDATTTDAVDAGGIMHACIAAQG